MTNSYFKIFNYVFLGFCLLFVTIKVSAQDPEKYNEIFTKTFIETSQKDFEKAIQIADSLFQISETPIFKTKSLMLSASLYEQVGDLKKSIIYAQQAGNIIGKTDNYDWQARVQGFLATQHRLLSLHSLSEKYADNAVIAAEKIKDKDVAKTTMGMLLQEKAFLENKKENYTKALNLFIEAGKYFGEEENNYLVAQNYQFKGQCALDLKEYDEAFSYLKTALDKWGDLPDNFVKGLIYINLAEVYMHQKKLDLAEENLNKARHIASNSSYLEYLNKFYEVQTSYFNLTSNVDSLKESIHKKDSIQVLLTAQKEKYIDESYTALNTENVQIIEDKKIRGYVIIGVILLLLGGCISFYYYRKEKSRQVQKFKSILAELEKSKQMQLSQADENQVVMTDEIKNEFNVPTQEIDPDVTEETSIMSPEIEQRILKKLKKFEKAELYTKSDISLPGLAAYCKTNTKYLSHCINQHKGMNYNNYINELRVQYIIDKLIHQPIYRKYKFATLADEAGFSSPNKFSTIFKQSTTISPSVFINELEKEAS